MEFDTDLFVVGAGSGGIRMARMAAQAGIRVMVADNNPLGGTCVNVGCIPKKLYAYASQFGHDLKDSTGFGWQLSDVNFNWRTLVTNTHIEIKRLNNIYAGLLSDSGVEFISGSAHLVDSHHVRVGDQVISAERILIATGGYPHVPESDYAGLLTTSDQIFDLPQFPHRMLIIGGGYIAVEFASIFNGLGSKVELVYRGNAILRGFDDDVRLFLATELQRQGVNIHFNRNLVQVTKLKQGGFWVRLDDQSEYEVDVVLSATGRRPRIAGLGLEHVGVAVDQRGAICVNEYFQTSINNIYALGDVVGRMELTPVALAEAMVLLDHWYGKGEKYMDYNLIPTAVFSQPSVATVGLTEQQAQNKYGHGRVNIFRSDFKALKQSLSNNEERTLMKLVVDSDTDRVLGIHMVGEYAAEILQGFAVALKADACKGDFDRTLGIHPSSAEEFVTMRTPVY